MTLTPTRDDRQPKMALFGGLCLLAGVLGVVTNVAAESAVSSWNIVLIGVLWGGGGYVTGRRFDLVAGTACGGIAVYILVAVGWPSDPLDATTVAMHAFFVLFSLALLVGAVGYLTGLRHANPRPWDVANKVFAGLSLCSLAVAVSLIVVG